MHSVVKVERLVGFKYGGCNLFNSIHCSLGSGSTVSSSVAPVQTLWSLVTLSKSYGVSPVKHTEGFSSDIVICFSLWPLFPYALAVYTKDGPITMLTAQKMWWHHFFFPYSGNKNIIHTHILHISYQFFLKGYKIKLSTYQVILEDTPRMPWRKNQEYECMAGLFHVHRDSMEVRMELFTALYSFTSHMKCFSYIFLV